MKERPLIMSAPMVRATLDDLKTQTRRIVRFPLRVDGASVGDLHSGDEARVVQFCPYGQPGDRLWVRETWGHDGPDLETVRRRLEDAIPFDNTYGPFYRATEAAPDTIRWRPSIHMPKWAARIWLEVTGVRVERLQDISEDDAIAEGVRRHQSWGGAISYRVDGLDLKGYQTFKASDAFCALWDSLNAKRGYGWKVNPWVWVIKFRRLSGI